MVQLADWPLNSPPETALEVSGLFGSVRCVFLNTIAFDVGVAAVEVEDVVLAPLEDIVDELQDRARPMDIAEVHDVVEARVAAEVIVLEDREAAVGHSLAMHRLDAAHVRQS